MDPHWLKHLQSSPDREAGRSFGDPLSNGGNGEFTLTYSSDFEPLFHPRSVAVVGASNDITKFGGRTYLSLKARRYQGGLYAVNPKVADVDGDKAYARVQDIPE